MMTMPERISPKLSPLLGLLVFTGVGCKDEPTPEAKPQVEPVKDEPKATVAATPAAKTAEPALPADKERPPGRMQMQELDVASLAPDLKYEGKATKAVSWTDDNGENIAIFSRVDDEKNNGAKLQLSHYARTDGKPKLLRDVEDGIESCEFDMSAEFRDSVLALTDLDADGYGELTFAFALNCTSDVSPGRQHLFMLENGDEYVINGEESIVLDGQPLGGKKEMESFKSAPAPFVGHVNAAWDELADESRRRYGA